VKQLTRPTIGFKRMRFGAFFLSKTCPLQFRLASSFSTFHHGTATCTLRYAAAAQPRSMRSSCLYCMGDH
jgi:hypothetical protein